VYISDEMSTFLDRKKGSMVTTTEVYELLNEYINLHCRSSLSSDQRVFILDSKVKRFLRTNNGCYVDIMSLANCHFTPIKPKPSIITIILEKKRRLYYFLLLMNLIFTVGRFLTVSKNKSTFCKYLFIIHLIVTFYSFIRMI
jgi:hypothetical protein